MEQNFKESFCDYKKKYLTNKPQSELYRKSMLLTFILKDHRYQKYLKKSRVWYWFFLSHTAGSENSLILKSSLTSG